MRERTAHERSILHPGKAQIRDKLAASAHQAIVFLAKNARADALPSHSNLLRPDKVLRRASGGIAVTAMLSRLKVL
ncbi:MAG: hypothetical protein WBW74_20285 [Xanthobacteraceae bacterium]